MSRRRDGETALARIVADYIAGMTDRFALQEHERLCRARRATGGAVVDAWRCPWYTARQPERDRDPMNLFSDIRALVLDQLVAMAEAGDLPDGLDMANVTVEPPRDAAHGDMATNAAMVLAKPAGMKPREIAEALAGAAGGRPAHRQRPRWPGRGS